MSFPKVDAKKCDAAATDECFLLAGVTLTFKNMSAKNLVLTKISD